MFQLRKNTGIGAVALVVLLSASSVLAGVVISEVDYDQPGTDTQEWVELYNPDATPQSLAGLELAFFNGTLSGSCAEYCRIDLDPYTIPANGYIVLGQDPCAVAPLCTTTNAIQNGSPDAIIVQDRVSGLILDSVEYESDLVNSVCNFNLTNATDSGSTGGSIQLCGSGWFFLPVPTPCGPPDCTVPVEPGSWSSFKGRYGN